MNINVVFDKLFDYYQINSLVELAHKLGVSQPALSQWKTRNAMSAVKKRCRELGIYNEIFGNLNSNINNIQNSEFNSSIAVNNGDNANINSKSEDLIECDDFTKTLFRQLCKVYKDKAKLHSKLFELIQNA